MRSVDSIPIAHVEPIVIYGTLFHSGPDTHLSCTHCTGGSSSHTRNWILWKGHSWSIWYRTSECHAWWDIFSLQILWLYSVQRQQLCSYDRKCHFSCIYLPIWACMQSASHGSAKRYSCGEAQVRKGGREVVSQTTSFAERGRVWSHCNHRVVSTAET